MNVNDDMHRKRGGRILGILKKSVELSSWLGRRRLTFASSPKPGLRPCGGCHACWGWGADGKASTERLCLFPYVETFNSKVVKGFVPELRNRYVFFMFRDSYVRCIYVTDILCTLRISVSWLWHSRRDKGFFSFSEGICTNKNAIARLEFELAYYDVTVFSLFHNLDTKPSELLYYN